MTVLQNPQRYRLELRHTIRKVDEDGRWISSDQLAVEDHIEVDAGNFLEMARILGQFHDLAERIRHGEKTPDQHSEAESANVAAGVHRVPALVTPGQIWIDSDGDVWTVNQDYFLQLDGGMIRCWADANRQYGPMSLRTGAGA